MKEDHRSHFRSDAWRVFRIVSELVDGFETLSELGPSVSIFGSARLHHSTPEYQLAFELAQKISQRGFAVVTGGGPGVMEAANKGALTGPSISCGIGIEVPHEVGMNPFVDPKHSLQFRYFFIRKVMFIRYTQACVFLPGGLGTLDELFEALTLVQTKRVKRFPIYLVGSTYWNGLFEWLKETAMPLGCIEKSDLDFLQITDDLDFVASGIEQHYALNHTEENLTV